MIKYIKKYVFLLLICSPVSFLYAQTIRSVTDLETSAINFNPKTSQFNYLAPIRFEEKLFWRKRYNKENQEKDSYYYHSIYFKDSVIGLKYFGFEFNFLHEQFDKTWLNVFRKWNSIRMGFSLSVEYKPFKTLYPINQSYEYLNAELYLKYYHIPKSTRGDRTTKYTRGAWGFLVNLEYFGRIVIDFKAKPFSYVWLHARYKKDFDEKYVSFLVEFEINSRGYDVRKVESTKDLYNGITLFLGPEYNLDNQNYALNLGLKMDFRNH